MTSKLKEFFPMIRNRQEILTEIHDDIRLQTLFYSWRKEQQEEFLNFCTGIRGVKILYDSFFKAILNPDAMPERTASRLQRCFLHRCYKGDVVRSYLLFYQVIYSTFRDMVPDLPLFHSQ